MVGNGIDRFERIDIDRAYREVIGNDCAVIAMPVTGSGQALLKLNRNLRISGHTGNRVFISPLVVASSKASFEQFRNSLVYAPDGLKYLFLSWRELFIGHKEQESSWEKELTVVEHFDSELWRQRARVLRDYKNGLCGAVGTPSMDPDERLEFTSDFAFWNGKEYDPANVDYEAVYVTVASLLQGLRDKHYSKNDQDSLYSHVYQHSVVAPDNFTRFTDALLQSCLWRAAYVRELNYCSSVEVSREFSGILERLIEENAAGKKNAAFDLLMGIATGSIQLDRDVLNGLTSKACRLYVENDDALLLLNYIRKK